jgi:hypothetical protein
MATTTTNYGFDIPQSTDLVKDGATAIATLGQDIDTAMNTALGTKKAGMVLLNTTSFSGVASQALDGIFSSTYRDYKILMDFNGSTAIVLSARLRTGAGDDSSANYQRQRLVAQNTVISGGRDTNQTSWALVAFGNTTNILIADIFSPNVAATTSAQIEAPYNTGSTNIEYVTNTLGMATSTQYTGINLICSTGNMTGSVSVYGYNK